ncbi:MAG: hypothetical protein QG672_553 [Pseudomonadota bacterium]|nr:hypothetical protein [Pseudomonadota bacterium]MDQ5907440.1 hypothetical protein [Pseudomonadota bacterium]
MKQNEDAAPENLPTEAMTQASDLDPGPTPGDLLAWGSQAVLDVAAERRRQIEAEGCTTQHDDANPAGVMSVAAGCYALSAGYALALAGGDTSTCPAPEAFPWDDAWWKPTTSRRDLVKAAALILAEIERLDRMAERQEGA